MYPNHSNQSTANTGGNSFTEVHHEVHHEVRYENYPYSCRLGRPLPANGQNTQMEENNLLPGNSLVIFNDYQQNLLPRQQTPATTQFENNLNAFIQIVNLFQIPVIITFGSLGLQNGSAIPALSRLETDPIQIPRTTLNPWDDVSFVNIVRQTGRQNLLFAGAIAEISLTLPAVSAAHNGYTTYALVDISFPLSSTGQCIVCQQLQTAGVHPASWSQVAAWMQRDWRLSPGRMLEHIFREYFRQT